MSVSSPAVHLVVLNYNGRRLLKECLPSVVAASRASCHRCRVVVVDNSSTDDSIGWVRRWFSEVRVIRRPNWGLCSLNGVVGPLGGEVAVLLNNDIRLDVGAVDPLVGPLLEPGSRCFLTAPRCWRFDGRTYEGFKTAVRWRWGLIQATSLFPGHERCVDRPGRTASAGAALAVRSGLFTQLGGFDPLFLPGRLEDLDFCFRGWMAGYHARYEPDSVAYHLGMGTFGPVLGAAACRHLALRNTLLFQWKNLRHPLHRLRGWAGTAIRLAVDGAGGGEASSEGRWPFGRALLAAWRRWREVGPAAARVQGTLDREREFFQQFRPDRLAGSGSGEARVPARPMDRVQRARATPAGACGRQPEAWGVGHGGV